MSLILLNVAIITPFVVFLCQFFSINCKKENGGDDEHSMPNKMPSIFGVSTKSNSEYARANQYDGRVDNMDVELAPTRNVVDYVE